MKKRLKREGLIYAVIVALSFCACTEETGVSCGSIDLLMDGTRYDVNTCEDLNFRNGCDYTLDYLDLCYEEGGEQYCREVSIAFATELEIGEFTIVSPEVYRQLTDGGNYIMGYFGELTDDESLTHLNHIESGRLTVTSIDMYTGTYTGSFEFKAKVTPESAKLIEVTGEFRDVPW